MKRSHLVSSVLLAVSAASCTAPDPRPSDRIVRVPSTAPLGIEEQAAEAARASQPRSEHRALSALVGHWNLSVVTVASAGAESDPHEGSATIDWILGGRYLRWEGFLSIGGHDYATTGFMGFDANQSEYQMLMISDLATGMGVARGRGDLAERGIRLTLEVADPSSGAIRRAQSVVRLLDPDHFVLDQVGIDERGVERVVRRTHYRRAGKGA